MFGKLIAIGTNLQHSFSVYQIRRFPSTKLPLFSINMTLVLMLIVARRIYWSIQEKQISGFKPACKANAKKGSKEDKEEVPELRWVTRG